MVMTSTTGGRDPVASDYAVPTGDYLNPGRTAPMPVPRNFPTEAPIPDGSGAADIGSTVDTGRRPTSHPALQG
jgi:hypothetical protein